jgi:glutamate synthase (NADPH/NADH) large chain
MAPIPSLLLTSAVHHHLIREKTRTRVGLVVEAGDAREVHHMALLVGYGAAAGQPLPGLREHRGPHRRGPLTGVEPREAVAKYVKAAGKGVLKVMSKMGISTIASYTGAQVFEALGLSQELVDEYFTGTTSRLGGIGWTSSPRRWPTRHRKAFPDNSSAAATASSRSAASTSGAARASCTCSTRRPSSGCSTPPATRSTTSSSSTPRRGRAVRQAGTLRGLFGFRSDRTPVPIDEVEPVSEIVKRFNTGAMSLGSISPRRTRRWPSR